MSLPTLSGLTTSVYGTNASNAISYNMAGVLPTEIMRENKLIEIANKAIAERTRRGASAVQLPSGYYSGQIYASRIQDIVNVVQVAGPVASQAYNTSGSNAITTYPQAAAPAVGTSFSRGQQIRSADINVLIGAINTAGAVCTCNCNYCTCNCNYCTCNCNYSCTCNCNYSDEQVKTNIEYI